LGGHPLGKFAGLGEVQVAGFEADDVVIGGHHGFSPFY
jgi:hypothetical protein